MKSLVFVILMIGLGIGVVGCENDEKASPPDEKNLEFNGRVVAVYSTDAANYKSDDGIDYTYLRGYIIVSESHVDYDPHNTLPNDFKINGLEVVVCAKDLQTKSSLGALIEIKEIGLINPSDPN